MEHHHIKQKQKRDISTHEIEFEKNKNELSFKPNIDASKNRKGGSKKSEHTKPLFFRFKVEGDKNEFPSPCV